MVEGLESKGTAGAETSPPSSVSKKEQPKKRHVLLRLFGISVWGWVKLILLCILIGFLVLASEFDPTSPNVDMGAAIGSFLSTLGAALRWAIANFWQPALAGAGIVLPIWFLWRLVSLPFRK
ncbi:MAG: hypothetical protein AAFR74_00705 [Pseudomonadota bacterium]